MTFLYVLVEIALIYYEECQNNTHTPSIFQMNTNHSYLLEKLHTPHLSFG